MVLSRRQLKLPIQGLTTYQVYGIFDPTTNQPVFDYDTFVSTKIDGKMKVSDFAVEQGAFATYNKVTHPNSIKIQLAVTDSPDRRHAFLTALDSVMKSTRLMNVVTQDATYLSMTLAEYSYSRTQASGWGKVVADLTLIEVRQVQAQYTSVKIPGGRGAVSNGQVIASVSPIFAPDATLESVKAYSAAQAKSATTGVQFINNASVSKAATKATSTPASATVIPTTAIIPSVR
jgi:hypothetical protein